MLFINKHMYFAVKLGNTTCNFCIYSTRPGLNNKSDGI